jgi:hypothetical protein
MDERRDAIRHLHAANPHDAVRWLSAPDRPTDLCVSDVPDHLYRRPVPTRTDPDRMQWATSA